MDEKILKDAQYRKGLSIAFFNATNAAINLAGNHLKPGNDVLESVVQFRDFFLEEHKKYYASVIAKIGENYKAEDSIKMLENSKTLEELETAWRLLSEDERRDSEIFAVAQKLKKQYHEKT